MNLIEFQRALRQLRLGGTAAVLETRLRQAQAEAMAPIDLISCLVSDAYRYATGRAVETGEADYMAWLKSRFAAGGYRLPDLLLRVALSDAFYRISPANTVKEAQQ